MDLDLSEYDQIDEFKYMKPQDMSSSNELLNPSVHHHSSRNLVVTLSSNSSEAPAAKWGSEDVNCENDFVFLPAPPPVASLGATSAPTRQQQQQQQHTLPEVSTVQRKNDATRTPATTTSISTQPIKLTKQISTQPKPSVGTHPLVAIDANSNSPFAPRVHPIDLATRQQHLLRLQQIPSSHPHTTTATTATTTSSSPHATPAAAILATQALNQANNLFALASKATEAFCHSKPTGLLEINTSLNSAQPDKLADLMRQIVSQSDHIYIAIPCAYCHEPTACPPSDISAWLNHMNRVHNCKICPICNKMIGLGQLRDIEIMRKHVNSHLDDDWLERRAPKVCFTFGLQQQWFAGSRCSVKETRYR